MAAGPRLAGRVALITGGIGEIGGALARRFAVEAAAVAVADIDPAKSKAVVSAIPNGGGRTGAPAQATVHREFADDEHAGAVDGDRLVPLRQRQCLRTLVIMRIRLARKSVAMFQAQYIGDKIAHIATFDYDVRHRSVRCSQGSSQRSAGHACDIGNAFERGRGGVG